MINQSTLTLIRQSICLCWFTVVAAVATAQHVGIGTLPSTYMLDVKGRAHLRQNGPTAGIFFDGPNTPLHGFAGMFSNDMFGLYSSGTNWQIGMNIANGNVGIGTMSPTANLDIAGDWRWRGGNPATNAILVSADGVGNAKWQRPVAFGVSGTPDLANLTLSQTDTWQKLFFRTTADYNQGFSWQVINSIFQAPATGVYRFSLHLQHAHDQLGSQVRIIRRSNGVNYVVAQQEFIGFVESIRMLSSTAIDLQTDVVLTTSDQIWVEVNPGFIYSAVLIGDTPYYSFSGRLLFLR